MKRVMIFEGGGTRALIASAFSLAASTAAVAYDIPVDGFPSLIVTPGAHLEPGVATPLSSLLTLVPAANSLIVGAFAVLYPSPPELSLSGGYHDTFFDDYRGTVFGSVQPSLPSWSSINVTTDLPKGTFVPLSGFFDSQSRDYQVSNTFGVSVPTVTFAEVFNGRVQVDTIEDGTAIQATFVPNYDLTLAQTAALGGFTRFDWIQTVTSDPTMSAFLQAGSAPFNDPPGSAFGTSYCTAGDCQNTEDQMIMRDQPRNPCFSADLSCVVGLRDVVFDPRDGTNFETELVGVLPDGRLDPLFGFTWASNYSGVDGEAYQYDNGIFDDGSGSGGAAILSERYFLTGTVPEPSTWAMMLLGFAGLGYAGWRGRRITAGAAA